MVVFMLRAEEVCVRRGCVEHEVVLVDDTDGVGVDGKMSV